MPEESSGKLRHLIVEGFSETENYKRPRGGSSVKVPEQDRALHSDHLLGQIKTISNDMLSAIQIQKKTGLEDDLGITIEFESFPEIKDAFDDLSFGRTGIELLNLRQIGLSTFATVFIPEGELQYFIKKIDAYRLYGKDKNGKPRDNQKLVDTIKEIRTASLRALWTDDENCFPAESEPALWWEAWLPLRGDREKTVRLFRTMAAKLGLPTSKSDMSFPERTVVLVFADREQMESAITILNTVAELRRAKETAEFFVELQPHEEKTWVDDLLKRTDYAEATDDVPRICILDTGVNRGHPLLGKALTSDDLHSVDPEWEFADQDGHGTAMAGLALYGDLSEPLSSREHVSLAHRLESSKLLPKDGANTGDEHLHANLTLQAVSYPEIAFPHRKRVYELAVSTDDYRDKGRPSSWSAAVDQLAADRDNDEKTPRLFVIAAGNINDIHKWERYPTSKDEEGIHDPGQSWNALTVGAYTNKVEIRGERAQGYTAIAPRGDISPFSTTSAKWDQQWPLKPDIVMEGGNAGRDLFGAACLDSLSLLTTNHIPSRRLLTTVNATSAASVLVARMAAQIMAHYPELRPETVRGLIVHSAEWTEAMKLHYGIDENSSKDAYANLVRHCGFGVPSLERALWSMSNSVTLVVEDGFYPFHEGETSICMNEMQYHTLPWPAEALSSMGETPVEMRVTLSYYIEPNPSSRGRSKYCYESHGLRFYVKQPSEKMNDFMSRKNGKFREDGTGYTSVNDSTFSWLLGEKARHHGSLHSDIWRGTAVGLADCNAIAVYPTGGWWQKRPALGKYSSAARYSLIVSIKSPMADVDLYTPIETAIKTRIASKVEIG